MLSIFERQRKAKSIVKPAVFVTATLANVLTPGMPAVYLYQGNLIRTSAVKAILEAAPNHVRFETKNKIYTLFFFHQPDSAAEMVH